MAAAVLDCLRRVYRGRQGRARWAPANSRMKTLHEQLLRRRAENLYRERRVLDSPQGTEIVVDGRRLLAFCSNDYLGLANDARVAAALVDGVRRWGVGAGASHLVSGHLRPHHALEEELAAFAGTERALLFSTGYMANLGVVAALADRHGAVYEDRLNHASLIDAARQTRARSPSRRVVIVIPSRFASAYTSVGSSTTNDASPCMASSVACRMFSRSTRKSWVVTSSGWITSKYASAGAFGWLTP